ncbi:MAG: CoB--CoM heterodisulfide reductase iron-sulfur subunit A family protein, partial [Candidatus Thorarchaeota archaeon]
GGNLNHLNLIYPIQQKASQFLSETIDKVQNNNNVTILLNSRIANVQGYLGNYEIQIADSDGIVSNLKIGTIVVATGGKEYKPFGLFYYDGKNPAIITQLELEERLKSNDKEWMTNINRIALILCVNSRQKEGITYCSNICCANVLKNIALLKKIKPALEIIVLYRDMQMAKKEFEDYYRERRKNAIFLRYDLWDIPTIIRKKRERDQYKIQVFDINLKEIIEFDTDLIILSTPMIPSENPEELAKLLKVPIEKSGFFLEAHVKLRPLDFATEGIFLCGCAQWPKNIQDSIAQANGAAGRAGKFLGAKEIKTSGLISKVIEEKCIGCGKCEKLCPYKAIELIEIRMEFEEVSFTMNKSYINPALCKGCGTCAANCPVRAISVKHYDLNQITAMIDTCLLEKS